MDRKRFAQWLKQIYVTAQSEIGCDQLQAVLPTYVDDEVAGRDPGPRAAQIRAHLAQCPDCIEEYEGLRRVAELEAQEHLPQVEESLAQFEEVREPEIEGTIPVVGSP